MTRMLTRDRATSIGEPFQDWYCRSRSAQVSGPEWRCWPSAWCGKTHFLERKWAGRQPAPAPFRTRRQLGKDFCLYRRDLAKAVFDLLCVLGETFALLAVQDRSRKRNPLNAKDAKATERTLRKASSGNLLSQSTLSNSYLS